MTGTTSRVQTLGGPALFVLLWSTGFVGAKYGLPYAKPFTFLSLRLAVAAAQLVQLFHEREGGFPAGADNAHRNLTSVGNQYFLNHFTFSLIYKGYI